MNRVGVHRFRSGRPTAPGRRLLCAGVVVLSVLCAGASRSKAATTVLDLSGTVLLRRGSAAERPPRKGDVLAPGDLVTARKAGALLMADGGGRYLLRANSAARIEGAPVLEYGTMQRITASPDDNPRSDTLERSGPLFGDVRYSISPGPAQGRTVKVLIRSGEDLTVSGSFSGGGNYRSPLRFHPVSPGVYRALSGFDVEQRAGRYILHVRAERTDGCVTEIRRPFTLAAAAFERGRVSLSEEALALLEPSDVKTEEREILSRILSEASGEALWNYTFRQPVEEGVIISSFGRVRLYFVNGRPSFSRSHRGIDFEGERGDPVIAPNSGNVVFSGMRTTTGNTIVIDHGQGVFSLLFHLDALNVVPGEYVVKGERIGEVGATGIVEGAHLHWGMFVCGVYVNPLDWIQTVF